MMRVFLTESGIDARRQARDLVVSVNQWLRQMLVAESVDRLLIEMRRLNEILDNPHALVPSDRAFINDHSSTP